MLPPPPQILPQRLRPSSRKIKHVHIVASLRWAAGMQYPLNPIRCGSAQIETKFHCGQAPFYRERSPKNSTTSFKPRAWPEKDSNLIQSLHFPSSVVRCQSFFSVHTGGEISISGVTAVPSASALGSKSIKADFRCNWTHAWMTLHINGVPPLGEDDTGTYSRRGHHARDYCYDPGHAEWLNHGDLHLLHTVTVILLMLEDESVSGAPATCHTLEDMLSPLVPVRFSIAPPPFGTGTVGATPPPPASISVIVSNRRCPLSALLVLSHVRRQELATAVLAERNDWVQSQQQHAIRISFILYCQAKMP